MNPKRKKRKPNRHQAAKQKLPSVAMSGEYTHGEPTICTVCFACDMSKWRLGPDRYLEQPTVEEFAEVAKELAPQLEYIEMNQDMPKWMYETIREMLEDYGLEVM
jgi:hypothetical protein